MLRLWNTIASQGITHKIDPPGLKALRFPCSQGKCNIQARKLPGPSTAAPGRLAWLTGSRGLLPLHFSRFLGAMFPSTHPI